MGARAAPALALENITVTFAVRDAKDARYTAVRDTTLVVQPGEFVSVVGPTGCGKSTLLNVAVGLLEPLAGSVKVFGAPLEGLNRKAGYLFQTEALMPWRTALDNVTAGLEFRGVRRHEAAGQAQDWLARVGLAGHGHRYPHQLSGGLRLPCRRRCLWAAPTVQARDYPSGSVRIVVPFPPGSILDTAARYTGN